MRDLKTCIFSLVFALLGLFLAANASTPTQDWLGEESVVLVCGAASYLGVELSLALHRTYKPKKLILVDELEDLHLSGDGFSQFELQRQRLFRVLQEVSTSDEGDIIFFRADLRPEVPEFVDSPIIPVLEYIVKQHPDISHVVYLPEKASLDEVGSEANPKALMMHAILDQLYQWKNTTGSSILPQFTYASSSLVYSGDGASSVPDTIFEGREDRPISEGPQSLEGIAYLLNEILAQSYYSDHQIDSIGLRFFQVYGPYESMPSLTAQIAGHAVSSLVDSSRHLTIPSEAAQPKKDYVFIDDAVDAIMLAMQVRAPANFGPLVVNVGSGKSTDVSELISIAQGLNPDAKFQMPKASSKRPNKVNLVASMERSKELLGWEPQVSLQEGMHKTLGWHFDRIFPEGRRNDSQPGNQEPLDSAWERISASGRMGCNINDVECLRGIEVFPCASECALKDQCRSSFWDAPAAQSLKASSHCSEVLYTISLDSELLALPAVTFRVTTQSNSLLPKGCNFAFVSEQSPLVARLRSENDHRGDGVLDYSDLWTLVPVSHDPYSEGISTVGMLPKISPGRFFAERVELALYTEPNVIVDDLPFLLSQARMKPFSPQVQTRTGMLVGTVQHGQYKQSTFSASAHKRHVHQTSSYRMYNIKMLGQVNGTKDELGHRLDSSFVVHALGEKLPRAFRCEVLKEVSGWGVSSYEEALSFVAGIHDKLSQMLVLANQFKNEDSPWWHGDKVETIFDNMQEQRRRLEESENGIRRAAPMQHHHLLQNHIMDGREVQEVEVHHFDEHGFAVRKEKLGTYHNEDPLDDSTQTNAEEHESEEDLSSSETDKGDEANVVDQIWLSMLAETTTRFFVRIIPGQQVQPLIVELS